MSAGARPGCLTALLAVGQRRRARDVRHVLVRRPARVAAARRRHRTAGGAFRLAPQGDPRDRRRSCRDRTGGSARQPLAARRRAAGGARRRDRALAARRRACSPPRSRWRSWSLLVLRYATTSFFALALAPALLVLAALTAGRPQREAAGAITGAGPGAVRGRRVRVPGSRSRSRARCSCSRSACAAGAWPLPSAHDRGRAARARAGPAGRRDRPLAARLRGRRRRPAAGPARTRSRQRRSRVPARRRARDLRRHGRLVRRGATSAKATGCWSTCAATSCAWPCASRTASRLAACGQGGRSHWPTSHIAPWDRPERAVAVGRAQLARVGS